MCPIVDMLEVRDRPQKRTVEKIKNENLSKEESIGTTENISREKDYFSETRNAIKEINTIPAKITVLHTRRENTILMLEEDPTNPWYFAHV